MDLIKDHLKKIYPKFLFASLGSAVVSSIYSLVDSVMIGQYEGPSGAAALAVMMPVYTIIFSLGLLFGIGGSVLMSVARGRGNYQEGNRYFTTSLISCMGVIAIVWALMFFLDEPLLCFFGGEGEVLTLAKEYFFYIRLGLPLFTLGQFFSCFVRNDGNPTLATASTLAGGIWNIFGDYIFIFLCDLGMTGAAIATITGQALSFTVLMFHFFTKRRRLSLMKPQGLLPDVLKVMNTGFASFALDFSVGVLCVLFNNRVMKYLGSDALAVYGVAVNVFMLIQSLAYGIGQASQPILSENFGARLFQRIKKTVFASILICAGLSVFGLIFAEGFPMLLVHMFMKTNASVEKIAPYIMRVYCLAFLFMPFNVFCLYFYQAIMRTSSAWIIAIFRGIVLSSIFIIVLPIILGGNMIWWAMPITEFIVFLIDIFLTRHYLKFMKGSDEISP